MYVLYIPYLYRVRMVTSNLSLQLSITMYVICTIENIKSTKQLTTNCVDVTLLLKSKHFNYFV